MRFFKRIFVRTFGLYVRRLKDVKLFDHKKIKIVRKNSFKILCNILIVIRKKI